ncbi:MAG: cation-translocating P-type ATPase C-terminal domain-containing protein [Thermodesulfobacteriaceae bacterium]|nr:cation-translocating P-type ATPase C-terminal domain-containing protein [Thermodesulfobacteriaceae bacterium]
MGNALACRSFKESLLTMGIFSNKFLLIGIFFQIYFQLFIVYHPVGNYIFCTYPLPFRVWLILIPFPIFLIISEELRKKLFKI